MIRRTSCEVLLCASVYYAAGITAFDGWICRVDVIRVGGCVKSLSPTEGGSQRILHLSVFISRAKLLYICLVFSNLAV